MKSSANGRYLLPFFILGYALPWRGDNIPLFRYNDRSRYIIVFNELPNFSIIRNWFLMHFQLAISTFMIDKLVTIETVLETVLQSIQSGIQGEFCTLD